MSDFPRSLKQAFRDAAAWWRIVSHWPGGALIDLTPDQVVVAARETMFEMKLLERAATCILESAEAAPETVKADARWRGGWVSRAEYAIDSSGDSMRRVYLRRMFDGRGEFMEWMAARLKEEGYPDIEVVVEW